MVKVSVIVPLVNNEEPLPAIDSLLRQSLEDFEIILVGGAHQAMTFKMKGLKSSPGWMEGRAQPSTGALRQLEVIISISWKRAIVWQPIS